MVSPKAIQALVVSLFMVVVLIGLFFLLRSQLAPLLEEMAGNSAPNDTAVTTTFTPAPLVPATLTAMNEVLAATVAPVATSTTPTPTIASIVNTVRVGIVNSEVINVRSYPDAVGDVVAQARQGERLEILATSTDGQWLRVCCPLGTSAGDRQSWVAAEFVTIEPEVTSAVGLTQSNTVSGPPQNSDGAVKGMVNSSGVNLRSGPGTTYAVVGQAQEQNAIEVTGRDVTSLWWRICCPPGAPTESWISAEFVTIDIAKEQALTLVPVVTPAATPATGAP